MITFRQHIEISKINSKKGSVKDYLDTIPLVERVVLIRDIESVYPLKDMDNRKLNDSKDFNISSSIMDLVLGQFVMLEQIITGKTNFTTEADNDLEIAKLLMRPKHHKEFDNSNEKEESENETKILDTDVRDVYSALTTFLKNRDYVLFKQFAGVFYEIPDEEDEEEEEDLLRKTAEQLFQQQWYWYSIVRVLAKEDVTKYNEVYMLSMSTVMPEMSFLAQKSKIDSARQKEDRAMRKL